MKKRKIVILAKNIDSGTGIFVLKLLNLGREFDVKIHILEKKRYTADEKDKGILYFSKKPTYRGYYGFSPMLLSELFREFIWFKNAVEEEKADIVMSLNTHCNILSIVVKIISKHKPKLVIYSDNNISAVVSSKLSWGLRYVLRILGAYLFNKADAVICVSYGVGEDFKKFFFIKKRVQTIYCGIDTAEINKLKQVALSKKEKNMLAGDKLKIISVGRFEKQKDFATLIRAFAEVNRIIRNSTLILIGDGTQKDYLEKLVKKLKLSPKVYFTGWKSNVVKYMGKADVFVLSSFYEGFGLVILEAMAAGLPIISTNSPYGPSEILGNGKYGLLVGVGDVGQLVNSCSVLLKDRKKLSSFSKKSKERVKYFSREKMLRKYSALFNNLIKK